MKTICPHCQQHYEIEDAYIGEIVQCTTCQQEFVVKKYVPEVVETQCAPHELAKNKRSLAGIFIRTTIFLLGIGLICHGILWSQQSESQVLSIVAGIIILPFAFVSLKSKAKQFYFICPNPNCKFEGIMEYNPEKGILGNVLYVLLMQAAGFRTIIYDDPTVTCPKCGMRTRHSMK